MPGAETGERETAYTARALVPLITKELESLGVTGLLVSGDGGAPQRPVRFLGFRFFPDIAVKYLHQDVWALEVKFVRGPLAQQAIATALGQAMIYRTDKGYPHSCVLLLETYRTAGSRSEEARDVRVAITDQLAVMARRVPG